MSVFRDEHRRWRMAERHRLTAAGRTDDVVEIVDDLVGLHSSDPATVYLSAFVRMENPSVDAVDEALYRDRTLVRHHAMRRTMWVMTPEVARLAHGAATAKVARAERRRTAAALADTPGLDDAERWLDNATGEICDLLDREGPLHTRTIGELLPHLVVPVVFGARTKHPGAINAHTKVLQGAGFDATLVRVQPSGTWISAEYAWALTETWLDGPISGLGEREAAGPLLDRWLRRFGPATETDIRWWFGWTAGLTRTALETASAIEVQLENGRGFIATGDDMAPSDPGPWVRLLPGLDPTIMGWKERQWYVDQAAIPRLFDRFGNAGPTIVVDGKVAGGWAQQPDGNIAVELVRPISTHHARLLDEAIAELHSALGDVVVRPRFPAPAQKDLFRT